MVAQQKTNKKAQDGPLAKGEDFASSVSWSLGGLIFSGYEFLDHQEGKGAEQNSPSSEKSGFVVSRTYLNFKAKAKTGQFKGWKLRVTTDISPAGEQADGCGSACEEDNDYNVVLKYAYFSIPLAFLDNIGGKNSLRFGQQHIPLVDAKAGVSLQKHWEHRYIAKIATEDLGLTSSADRGLAFIHEQDHLGLHLLFANGEGYHHNNAENQVKTESTVTNGSGDSTAMDIYGLLSFVPTGKNTTFHLSLNFPFRLHNITEISENDVTGEDDSNPTRTIKGDRRALKDVIYGAELDLGRHYAGVRLNLGLGSLVLRDKRGAVYYSDTNELLTDARDASGFGHYAFLHFRWAWLGAFYRYAYGSAVTGDKGKIEAIERNADKGNGRFHKRLYGITIFPSAQNTFFRLSLGVEDLLTHKDEREGGGSKKDRQTFLRTQLKL